MEYSHRYRKTYKGIKLDIKAHNQDELIDKINRRKEQIDRQQRTTFDGNMKLLDFGMQYLETYKRNNVSSAWYQYQASIIKNHIVDGIGNKRMNRIKTIEVQSMLNNITASQSFIDKTYNLTCQVFHHAYKNGLTDIDISEDLTKPKGQPVKAGKSLTSHEQRILLKVISGHQIELLCKLMLFCGLRIKEARELQWCDVDLNNLVIHIHGTKTKNADRVVPIPDEFAPDLIAAHKGKTSFDVICPFSEQQCRRGWNYIKRLMNIEMGCRTYRNKLLPPFPLPEPLRLYDLRHTYCTNLEKMGVPINIASRLMGHSDISVTSQIYTHESDESLEMARALINGKTAVIKPLTVG